MPSRDGKCRGCSASTHASMQFRPISTQWSEYLSGRSRLQSAARRSAPVPALGHRQNQDAQFPRLRDNSARYASLIRSKVRGSHATDAVANPPQTQSQYERRGRQESARSPAGSERRRVRGGVRRDRLKSRFSESRESRGDARRHGASTKLDVYCDGRTELSKLTSELLQIRVAVRNGLAFERACLRLAPHSGLAGNLACVLSVSSHSEELVSTCLTAGLSILERASFGGVNNLTVGAREFDAIEAIARESAVLSIGLLPRMAAQGMPRDVSQGASAIRADDVIRTMGIDGTGIRVGVISDSVNVGGFGLGGIVRNGRLTDSPPQRTRDLPPSIRVLSDATEVIKLDVTNEGAGMLEIVHDVAPGAELSFFSYRAALTTTRLAEKIVELATEPGFECQVIVDDLVILDDPIYQDGPVAEAISKVAIENGVCYVTSAGNYGSWAHESVFFQADDVNEPDGLVPPSGRSLHDFGRSLGMSSQTHLEIEVPEAGSELEVTLRWMDPFERMDRAADGAEIVAKGATTDFDLYLVSDHSFPLTDGLMEVADGTRDGAHFEVTEGNVWAKSVTIQGIPGAPRGNPIERIVWSNPGGVYTVENPYAPTFNEAGEELANFAVLPPRRFFLVINHSRGRKDVRLHLMIQSKQLAPEEDGYERAVKVKDVHLLGARTIAGHATSDGALAVAAMHWKEIEGKMKGRLIPPPPPRGTKEYNVEFYSSMGGRIPIQFSPEGELLKRAEYRLKPDVTGPDGVTTASFGRFRNCFCGVRCKPSEIPLKQFCGTSAAAPHVAGVGALMLAARHDSAGVVRQTIRDSARDAEEMGTRDQFDPMSGYGIVDSMSAVTYTGRMVVVPRDYKTVQAAIDAAVDGSMIVVRPGVYREQIAIHGKDIVLRSTNPRDKAVVRETVLRLPKHAEGSVVSLSGGEPATCRVAGFTIQGGSASEGGGIRGNRSNATIEFNRIIKNFGISGGGIAGCDGMIRENLVAHNVAFSGGGGIFDCNGTIIGNEVRENRAANGNGGGMLRCGNDQQRALVARNSVLANEAVSALPDGGNGGGIAECRGHVWSNIIGQNRCSGRGGGAFDCDELFHDTVVHNVANGGGGSVEGVSDVRNCILWGNVPMSVGGAVTVVRSNVEGMSGGNGNVSVDPLFMDPNDGDYHIRSESPCEMVTQPIPIEGFEMSVAHVLGLDVDGKLRRLPGELMRDFRDTEVRTRSPQVTMGADEGPGSGLAWQCG